MTEKYPYGFLVYVRSAAGVSPRLWAELYFGERGDRRDMVVATFPLIETEMGLSLDELARRHPLPADDSQAASRNAGSRT